ncbi:hypothetical protein HFO42_22550 [Rhizobium leguminosarum]|uniref:PNPLA domain-containing protein n=1 Tax=Rhizobium leguminosarum TaxID=384 RepID=A0AAJ1EFM7_RHILE|nr:hypothetical protein [Rhizobium leguminosarum]MBY5594838.1 hypothetical protein [Rhizobium leguminosarum]MBY5609335.1 hypothetical protein [Rhizobium leguminosarum]MBY5618875.1 hypothetical protein [Rhizobium leguminosarum]MBY5630863.1 hypothetical protein [Rhizobium leguminosarum]
MRTPEIWLCLSGGNALGAFHAGAYQVLHENQFEPDRIAGASIGAVTGGLIAGNRPEQRLARLRIVFGSWQRKRTWSSSRLLKPRDEPLKSYLRSQPSSLEDRACFGHRHPESGPCFLSVSRTKACSRAIRNVRR